MVVVNVDLMKVATTAMSSFATRPSHGKSPKKPIEHKATIYPWIYLGEEGSGDVRSDLGNRRRISRA